jgi:hypothetical protein
VLLVSLHSLLCDVVVAFLSQGCHLVLLLLNEGSLCSYDLFQSNLIVLFLLFFFKLNNLLLDFVGLSVLLLSGKLVLDLLVVKKLTRCLEDLWNLVL